MVEAEADFDMRTYAEAELEQLRTRQNAIGEGAPRPPLRQGRRRRPGRA